MKRSTLTALCIAAICVVALSELVFVVFRLNQAFYAFSQIAVLLRLISLAERLVMVFFFGLAAFITSGRLRLDEPAGSTPPAAESQNSPETPDAAVSAPAAVRPASDAVTPAAAVSPATAVPASRGSGLVRVALWCVIALLTLTALFVVSLISSGRITESWDWLFTMLMIDYYAVLGLAGASLRKPAAVRIATIAVCVLGLLWSLFMIWGIRNWYNSDPAVHFFFTCMIAAFWGGHSSLILRVSISSAAARLVQLLTIGMGALAALTLLFVVWGPSVSTDSYVSMISTQSILVLLGSILTPLIARLTGKRS